MAIEHHEIVAALIYLDKVLIDRQTRVQWSTYNEHGETTWDFLRVYTVGDSPHLDRYRFAKRLPDDLWEEVFVGEAHRMIGFLEEYRDQFYPQGAAPQPKIPEPPPRATPDNYGYW